MTKKELENKIRGKSVIVISDYTVNTLYRDRFSFPAKWFLIEPGELSKTREVKEMIEDFLLSHNVKRDVVIIGFGGGVVTDLAGFVAATYLRGVSYIAVPTTLMGMIDAAIGGKCGVNTVYGKNTIGAFYPPEYVHIDPVFLQTLPEKEIKSGLMEIIKYGIIWDETILNDFEDRYRDMEFLMRCIAIKSLIVEKDKYDQGLRQALNFGHTVAHALERVSKFQITHGEALWFGLGFEITLNRQLGNISKEACERVWEILFRVFHFNKASIVSFDDLYNAMLGDKKNKNNGVFFVCLEKLGKVLTSQNQWVKSVDRSILLKVYHEVRDQTEQNFRCRSCTSL